MAYLILIRHGKSDYNIKGLWTGWDDPSLNEEGIKEAKIAALELQDIHLDIAYSSALKRARETLEVIKQVLNRLDLPVIEDKAINERNYGIYTAKNKWDIKKELGEEEFKKLRRGWDYPIPEGESLREVYERIIPYYEKEILPKLKDGKNIILSSSGNALRALVKYLENISDDAIPNLEIATGEVYVYQINSQGNVIRKEIRARHPNTV